MDAAARNGPSKSVSGGGHWRTLRWCLAVAVAAGVVAAHFAAVESCPLPVSGVNGEEYTTQVARAEAVAWTADQTLPAQVLLVPANLLQLDGDFPALLHVIASLWSRIAGSGIEASLHLNLLFVALLALSVGASARQLAVLSGRVEPGQLAWVGTLAGASASLVPAVFAGARQYDYDLPMAAWCAAATALALYAPRSLPVALAAGGVSAVALLTRWSAVVFLLPLWSAVMVLAIAGKHHRSRVDTVLRIAAGAAVAALLCLPIVSRSQAIVAPISSFFASAEDDEEREWTTTSVDAALARGTDNGEFASATANRREEMLGRARAALSGLVRSSLGLAMACVLLASALVGYRCWRLLLLGATVCALPVLLLLVFTDGPIGPSALVVMVPWIVATVVAAWASCRPAILRGVLLVLVVAAGTSQLAAVDERPRSPHRELESMVHNACDIGREGGYVLVDPGVLRHRGIAWFAARHCPGAVVDEAVDIPDEPPGRPAAAITTDRLHPPWPAPCEQIDVRFEEVETVFRYWVL